MLSYLTLIPYGAMIGIHIQLLLKKFYLQTLVSNAMVLKNFVMFGTPRVCVELSVGWLFLVGKPSSWEQ